ncbi:MAG: uroporphyrinogen-III C-methyltransferase [Actinomycetota bacterium]
MKVFAYLVGAGPGDPGLITRRGLELIRTCDVLLYDRLVSPALLDEAPEGAERIFVGKSPGAVSTPQASIDALIVEHARARRRVVRLKGGDPFVFGRGADEGQALAAAGVPFEIVPGVSAAVAVPAYAGIPVTHGGVASSFAVITAHESGSRPGSDERFLALARGAETLVMLMGVSALRATVEKLKEAGRPDDEPVAFVERGTTTDQRTVVATLASAVEVAEREAIVSPTTVVVGQVVKLRNALNWFESLPLFGTRVVVTRPSSADRSFERGLAELGAQVIVAPTISIEPPADWSDLDAAIVRLSRGDYDWVVFSSVNAVERFFEYLMVTGDARVFGATKVAAVGPATRERLRGFGVRADLVPPVHTGVATAAEMGPGAGRVLLPRSEQGLPDVIDELQRLGWSTDDVATYRTELAVPPVQVLEQLQAGAFDVVTFASPSAVEGFVKIAGDALTDAHLVATIGPSTSERATALGLKVGLEAHPHTTQGLISALDGWGTGRGTISP